VTRITPLAMTFGCLLLLPMGAHGGEMTSSCENPCGPSCAAATILGTICGDQDAGRLALLGCGGGWVAFTISECAGITPTSLSFVAILSGPDDGTVYGLSIMQGCATPIDSTMDPSHRRKSLYYEWEDGWGLDDTRDFGLEIRLLSGSPSDNWHLEIIGNASPLTPVLEKMPSARMLSRNVPNPFNPQTAIEYELPAAGAVRLAVHDVRGRLVRILVEASLPAGSHRAIWDGRDAAGRGVDSGAYLCRLEAGGRVESRRMLLLK
jgi:hypothetical protein